jgi:cytochrome c551/c552
MWNHAPAMAKKLHAKHMSRPEFTGDEMLDLFGFLYYLRFVGPAGSADRGRALLASKGCLRCHRIGGDGGTLAPEFEKVQQYDSPLYLVQAMWNHSALMHEEIKKSDVHYPRLTGRDISDISACVRKVAAAQPPIHTALGDPFRGRGVIESKHCSDCHIIDGRGKSIGPSLDKLNIRAGVTGIASAMWNHGPAMMKYMTDLSIQWPRFVNNEMADLIAYLYFVGFEDKPGSSHQGRALFTAKGCAGCHVKGGKAPQPQSMKPFDSPIRMVQLMWNHAGKMEDLLVADNKDWPRLNKDDLRDLYAYLRDAGRPE